MAVTMRASARPLGPVGGNKLSAAYGGSMPVTVFGIPDLDGVYTVSGTVTAGPPATYADITPFRQGLLVAHQGALGIEWDDVAGTWTATLTLPVEGGDVAEGQEVWVAMFTISGSPPGPTDVPDAVGGPFTVLA